jgi:hypothetical protein
MLNKKVKKLIYFLVEINSAYLIVTVLPPVFFKHNTTSLLSDLKILFCANIFSILLFWYGPKWRYSKIVFNIAFLIFIGSLTILGFVKRVWVPSLLMTFFFLVFSRLLIDEIEKVKANTISQRFDIDAAGKDNI